MSPLASQNLARKLSELPLHINTRFGAAGSIGALEFRLKQHLHYDDAAFEFSFGRAVEQLVDFLLNLLTDLLLAAFLANRAGDVLNLDKVGLYRRPGQVHWRSTLWASAGHGLAL